jgi:putative transposase
MVTRQLELALHVSAWGGSRRDAGRPRGRTAVAHASRADFAARYPVHVTLEIARGVPSLRTDWRMQHIRGVIASSHRDDFRIVHFGVMWNHLHLIVEADGKEALRSGLQGFKIRFAKCLNGLFDRTGRLFGERYHERVLKTPREVRNALRYALNNFRHHTSQRIDPTWFDPYTSAAWFDGWSTPLLLNTPAKRALAAMPAPTKPPTVWLLAVGWRRHGAIALDEVPGSKKQRTESK